MKNHLTLEDLCPYLPFGLKIYDLTSGDTIDALRFITSHHQVYEFGFSGNLNQLLTDSKLKPMLRPLSDLTNPIKVEGYNDGKEFVPWLKLCDECPYYGGEEIVEFINGDSAIGISFDESNRILRMLYRWHFDVNNLIGRELAVDVNSIEK